MHEYKERNTILLAFIKERNTILIFIIIYMYRNIYTSIDSPTNKHILGFLGFFKMNQSHQLNWDLLKRKAEMIIRNYTKDYPLFMNYFNVYRKHKISAALLWKLSIFMGVGYIHWGPSIFALLEGGTLTVSGLGS